MKDERKWMFLKAFEMKDIISVPEVVDKKKKAKRTMTTYEQKPGSITETPQFFVNSMQAELSLQLITSLRIALGAQPIGKRDFSYFKVFPLI